MVFKKMRSELAREALAQLSKRDGGRQPRSVRAFNPMRSVVH